MNKAERKTIEKVALSNYAKHLYDGLTIHQNYELVETFGYWQSAKADPGAMCPVLFGYDHNVYDLIEDFKRNVETLETYFKEHGAAEKYREYRKAQGWELSTNV